MDSEQLHKLKLAVFIGFLTIALFAILGGITVAAAGGNTVARWILGLIFGVIALALASYAIGYAILAIMDAKTVEETPPLPKKKNSVKKKRSIQKKRSSKKRKKKKK